MAIIPKSNNEIARTNERSLSNKLNNDLLKNKHPYIERMFGQYGKERVIGFVMQARYFTLTSAFGGIANDSDEMSAVIEYTGYDDLVSISFLLGIDLGTEEKELKEGLEQLQKGKFPSYLSLGHHHLSGSRFFYYLSNNMLIVKPSNKHGYDLCEADFEGAKIFEEMIGNSFLARKAKPSQSKSELDITKERILAYTSV